MKSLWTTILLVLWFASFLTVSQVVVCVQGATHATGLQYGTYPQQPTVNLYINGSQTFSIVNSEFSVTGTIFVQDQATLDVENATLNLNLPAASNTSDVLRATDTARIHIINSTVNLANLGSDNQVTFSCYDQSEMDITGVSFQGEGFFAHAYNTSTLNIQNINTSALYVPGGGAASYGNSSLSVENSSIQGVGVYDNSKACVTNDSIVGELDAGWDQGQTAVTVENSSIPYVSFLAPGEGSCQYTIENSWVEELIISPNSTAHVTGSSIVSDLITSGNSTVTLKDTPVGRVETYDNSTVTLEDSTAYWVQTYNDSTVTLTRSAWTIINKEGNSSVLVGNWFFGTSLPLTSSVPYTWVVPLEIFFIVTVIVVISALLLVVRAIWLSKKHARSAE